MRYEAENKREQVREDQRERVRREFEAPRLERVGRLEEHTAGGFVFS
ncbi:hypothetical protein [Rhodothermus marinus]|uniref:Uncharacterized protein n=1 Tax=Rhodothermus marinus (strain ATCC 43812 / DSM 4252 / R-10) TaxID=518766 RepID=D0MDU5_RHOM4|nr:hypothetical protein [Rhodothermus marinus]ACY49089.1 hypothetical protein Rmar_2210 [Rhodothermus marinus DSM 4252]